MLDRKGYGHEEILDELEDESILCRRAPLSEYLLFLWKEASGNASASGRMKECEKLQSFLYYCEV